MPPINRNNEDKLQKYLTFDEIVIHNEPRDFWVVVNRVVMDLTPMIKDRTDSMNDNLRYLLAFGGKDLSYYFNENGVPRTEISGATGRRRVIFGPAIECAQSSLCHTPGLYWWEDPFYRIGQLTKQERKLRIINTLTGQTHLMKVCEEDTIEQIQEKYRKFYNNHAGSYVWIKGYEKGKGSGRLLFNKTLTENGLFLEKAPPPPAIWLYYSDDFTIA